MGKALKSAREQTEDLMRIVEQMEELNITSISMDDSGVYLFKIRAYDINSSIYAMPLNTNEREKFLIAYDEYMKSMMRDDDTYYVVSVSEEQAISKFLAISAKQNKDMRIESIVSVPREDAIKIVSHPKEHTIL